MQTGTQLYQQEAIKARRDELILNHLSLVRHAIGRLAARLPSGVDVENIESAGVVGLVEAANRFDPERGVKFETYAYARIRGAMLDELRRSSLLPQQMLENLAIIRRAYRVSPVPVTVEALAKGTGMTTDQVTECLAAMRWTRMLSLDEVANRVDVNHGNPDDQPAAPIEQAELQQLLAKAISALADRFRTVVTLYYLEDLRLKEIAQVLGLSESRVSRILDEALFELGEFMRSHGAEELA
jgi:RNA polymerase sigma factor for flagellar operon FliA